MRAFCERFYNSMFLLSLSLNRFIVLILAYWTCQCVDLYSTSAVDLPFVHSAVVLCKQKCIYQTPESSYCGIKVANMFLTHGQTIAKARRPYEVLFVSARLLNFTYCEHTRMLRIDSLTVILYLSLSCYCLWTCEICLVSDYVFCA